MAKSIKPKNNVYIDSTGIVHNRQKLSDMLNINITNSSVYKANYKYKNKEVYVKYVEATMQGTAGNQFRCGLPTTITPIKAEVFIDNDVNLFSGDTPRQGAETELCWWWNYKSDIFNMNSNGYNRTGTKVLLFLYFVYA